MAEGGDCISDCMFVGIYTSIYIGMFTMKIASHMTPIIMCGKRKNLKFGIFGGVSLHKLCIRRRMVQIA